MGAPNPASAREGLERNHVSAGRSVRAVAGVQSQELQNKKRNRVSAPDF